VTNSASQQQLAAADPSASVWLHANAGSGKTKVLIDRVARLLLSGVEPQNVLCLTYTKAAAAEMQNRLFMQLGQWAMMPSSALQAALQSLGPLEGQLSPDLAGARRLFARAIETPGGLRIQTIHSFCAALLRRFPLEAGVSPQFRELDDRSAILMRSEIAQEIAGGPQAASFEAVARCYSGDDLDDLLAQIARRLSSTDRFLDEADVRDLFGVPQDETLDRLIAEVFLGSESALFARILPIAEAGSPNDQKVAGRLNAMSFASPNTDLLLQCEDLFLFGAKAAHPFCAKTAKLLTQGTQGKLVSCQAELDDFMLRIERGRMRRILLQAAEKTAALHGFARHFVPLYEQRKAAQGLLDFDDQISRAKGLLTDHSVAQWVLYRLDGGIEHILVDEAQDTSPDQWEVLERLTEAFMDGDPGRQRPRTVFVVGDKKQSIYSFQGADLLAFDAMKQRFGVRLANIGERLQTRDMLHSFRSSPAILQVVDATFDREETASVGGKMQHIAFFDQMPGRVELWQPIEPQKQESDEDGFSPVDLTTDEHHAVQMGNRVADWIAAVLAQGMRVPMRKGERPVEPGDILVLVQRRAKIFGAVIAACKARGLPIAGADRLKLGEELAVKDLMALLAFLAMDTDDLSLAIVMRSPLGGLSEAELFDLAHGRSGSLWLELKRNAARHAEFFAMLSDLRSNVDLLRPYDLLERTLTRHGGRLRLVARLGQEAEDGIDELLTQSLAYEAAEIPSITGFLSWLTAGEIDVKRQMETSSGQIRVMTVHGAKGLEAPIVILPDTADQRKQDREQVIRLGEDKPNGERDQLVIWATSVEASPPLVQAEKAGRRAKRDAEDDRLLYVAMTRAQSLLVVGAAGRIGKDSDCWYRKISAGMARLGAGPDGAGNVVHSFGDWPENVQVQAVAKPVAVLPDWVRTPFSRAIARQDTLSPSALGGAKALPGEAGQDMEVAMARGVQLHDLLENLPAHDPAEWPRVAQALRAEEVLDEASRVIERHPELFHVDTLAEVPITAALSGKRMLGVIDRLVVSAERVLAVDFKSNQVIPRRAEDVPEGILRQMGAYAAALAQIYPDKRIETAILWTRTAELMQLDPDIVSAALVRALSLDVSAPTA
jgi:ATP-dependent helicase/nuclease subunit A